MIKAVIFDLDGTLLNTLDDLTNSVNHMLTHYGFEKRTMNEVKSFIGDGARQLVERSLGEGSNKEKIDEYLSFYEAYYDIHKQDLSRPYDGIIELLDDLKARNIKMAVVSNKPDDAVKPLVETLFGDYFELAIGESKDLKRKPSPEMLHHAIKSLGLKKEEVIFVGDSDVDMQTAINAKVKVIACLWGFRDFDVLSKYNPDYIVNVPNEINNIIK